VTLALAAASVSLAADTKLKEEMRSPWTRGDGRFLRHWLVVSDLPLAEGFDKDWLAAQGGETGVHPAEKMAVKLPDGKSQEWRSVVAWSDEVDLSNGPGVKRDLIAYAFATVTRAEAGKAVLSLGSDESMRVWLNGALVLDKRTSRPQTFDEDRVAVEMKAGENTLLVKSEQRVGPQTISARVLEPGAMPARIQEIGPSLRDSTPGALVVATDINGDRAALDKVEVTVVGAGGKVAAERTALRGERLSFDPAAWPDGPYEVRCTTHRPNGLVYATHLAWYKGDAVAHARRLLAAAAQADDRTTSGFTTKMLADMVLDRLDTKDLDKVTGNPWWAIHSPLMEFDEMQREAKGVPSIVRPYGFARLAYRDEVDGSAQFALAYLPGGYDPAKKWPLVVKLHGYNPANPEYVRWWGVDSRHHALADTEYNGHQGVIYMEPRGRGNTSYIGIGDQDVVRVIQLAKERFNVDEDRVYLMGDSMGGWGTWNVGTRHPDLFAAIAPIFGGVDYHSQLSAEALAKLTPLARYFQETASSWSMAESLVNMPIFVHHGDVDKSVNVDWSRYGVRLLQRWGYNIRYEELPGYGHEDLNRWADIFNWFLEHRREANPARVRLHTAELKNGSAYWARIDQAVSPGDFMTLDAEITDPNTIRLDTRNVATVTLSPVSPLIDRDKPVTVNWNGVAREAAFDGGRLRLGEAPASTEKNSRIAGPVNDVFTTPFAIVTGTSASDPEMKQLCAQKAEALAAAWKNWQRVPARVFKDSELTDADAARYSLLLIGGADANLVTRKLADRIPLEVSADHVKVGSRSFVVADARVQLIYPNPLNKQRYVVVVAATSAAGMYFVNPNEVTNGEFDFTIQDGRVPGAPGGSAADLAVAGGWFNRRWEFEDAFCHAGDTKLRAGSALVHAPGHGPSIDSKVLDSYAGNYQIAPNVVVGIERKENRLMGHGPGSNSPEAELLPISESEFFVMDGMVQIAFVKDAAGKTVSLKGSQNGQAFTAKKME
jgi:pimeloyl-ACP methyl ester carboxylesterase